MKKTFLASLFFFCCLYLMAQESKVDKLLVEIRKDLSGKKGVQHNEELLFTAGNEMFVLTRIPGMMADSLKAVRMEAVTIVARLGLKTTQDAFRQEAVRLLVLKGSDRDAAIGGLALDYLTHFNRHDFATEACGEVRNLLHGVSPNLEVIIKITGFLDLKDQVAFLKDTLLLKKVSTKLQWNIHLALARMGNENSIQTILDLVREYPVDDNIMYHIVPDLVYTRQKAIFSYLLEILNSDKKNCSSPNPYFGGNIICGYRVMEELAGRIVDLPLKKGKSGDIVTDDYEKALKTTREWFKLHEAYTFNMETY